MLKLASPPAVLTVLDDEANKRMLVFMGMSLLILLGIATTLAYFLDDSGNPMLLSPALVCLLAVFALIGVRMGHADTAIQFLIWGIWIVIFPSAPFGSANRSVGIAGIPMLLERSKAKGLAVLVVTDPGTREAELREYLAAHPLPGAVVAVDASGATYGEFFVKPGFFGIPRVLLVDCDGKVVFEGGPGLRSGREWKVEDGPTYVDAALAKLLGG